MTSRTANWGISTFLLLAMNGAMLLLSGSIKAQDSRHRFSSATGDTTFPASAQGACAGKVVPYNTRYQGTDYQGYLWVQSPAGSGCEGGRGRTLRGYFEERGSSKQWCKGQLTVYLTQDPRGGSNARWHSIAAVPGYACAGAGSMGSSSLSQTSANGSTQVRQSRTRPRFGW